MAPIAFCGVAAPSASSGGGREGALERCLVCCEDRPKYVAVGHCGHAEVCWICIIRLRTIMKDVNCPVCKVPMPEIAISPDGRPPPRSAPKDNKLGITFSSAGVREDVDELFDYRCWQRSCAEKDECFPTLEALQHHVEQAHRRRFCATCLRGRKVFLFEQLLYSPDDLRRHHEDGDTPAILGPSLPTSPPHASCTFCNKSFYSEEDLIQHMQMKHQPCGLCEKLGRKGEYYEDYRYLSLHYEEDHYVCKHEKCHRGSLRLVAFNTEDELWLHEVKVHSSKMSQKARKRIGDEGSTVNISMGATSYREEEPRAKAKAKAKPRDRWAVELGEACDGTVHFMRPRGTPKAPSEGDWPKLSEGPATSSVEADEENRYPPRAVPKPRAKAKAVAKAADRTSKAPKAVPVVSAKVRPTTARNSESEAHAALARVLFVAVQRIGQTGIDQVAGLQQEEYRAKNRRFKRDLEEQLGQAELVRFKECSMQYRLSLQDGGGTAAAETYAQRVVEVFATTLARSGEAVAAELLCDLVVLLPDQVPRHLLRDALAQLCGEEEDAVERSAEHSAPVASSANKAKPQKKATGQQSSAALPRQLDQKIEAIPLSRSSRGGDGKPSFLASLNVVLEAMAGQAAKLPLSQQALRRSVKLLDVNQAESLQLLHQHLVDAGGASLDYEPMDRLLALRPLLLLKLQGAASASGALAADRVRSWWEWKEAAGAALLRLGNQERQCVQTYVSLCLSHLNELESRVPEAEAGYPATTPAKDCTIRPAVAPAWDRFRPAPAQSEFPALSSNQPQPRQRQARA